MNRIQWAIWGALLAGSFAQLNADESIDDQIAEIQKAPAAERVQLMNQFKKKLANMNEEEQIKAMTQMRERLQSRNQSRTGNAASEAAREAQKRMNQLQRMNQIQQMNQMQQNMGQIQNMNMNGAMQGGKR